MLQRIQTIFLLIAALSSLALTFVQGDFENASLDSVVSFAEGFLTVATFINIFNYKKRPLQVLVNNVLIIINVLLIGLLTYWLLNLSGGIHFPEKGIELLFPVISIFCLIMANIYIRRDERLVKSVDRLR